MSTIDTIQGKRYIKLEGVDMFKKLKKGDKYIYYRQDTFNEEYIIDERVFSKLDLKSDKKGDYPFIIYVKSDFCIWAIDKQGRESFVAEEGILEGWPVYVLYDDFCDTFDCQIKPKPVKDRLKFI